MKNRILAFAAASAALGTAAISAPAQAQITGTPANVGVTVNVPEILYLRTVSNITLNLDPNTDIGYTGASPLTTSGTGFYGTDSSGTADGTTGVDPNSPFGATNFNATKTVPNVYAIWSNSPRSGGITATVGIGTAALTGPNGGTGTITSALTAFGAGPGTGVTATAPAPGLITPALGAVTLGVQIAGTQAAGGYTGGVITVTAAAP